MKSENNILKISSKHVQGSKYVFAPLVFYREEKASTSAEQLKGHCHLISAYTSKNQSQSTSILAIL